MWHVCLSVLVCVWVSKQGCSRQWDTKRGVWIQGGAFGYKEGCLDTGRGVWIQGGAFGYGEGCLDTKRGVWIQGGVFGYREGRLDMERGVWIQRGVFGYREGRLDMERGVWIQRGVFGYREGCLDTYLRSCRISLALYIVMMDVVAAGMMIIGVREPEMIDVTKIH